MRCKNDCNQRYGKYCIQSKMCEVFIVGGRVQCKKDGTSCSYQNVTKALGRLGTWVLFNVSCCLCLWFRSKHLKTPYLPHSTALCPVRYILTSSTANKLIIYQRLIVFQCGPWVSIPTENQSSVDPIGRQDFCLLFLFLVAGATYLV